MSRPHCARSFPPKLSISDSCRFLRVRAVSGLPVFLHLIWFLQFLFCFSITFHSAQLLRRVYHTVIHAFYCRVRWCVTTAIAQEVLHGKVFFFFFHRPLHNHLLALSLLVLSQSIPNIEGRAFPPK